MRHLSVLFVLLAGAGVVAANENAEVQISKAIKAAGIDGKPIPKAFRWKAHYTIDVPDKNNELQKFKLEQTLTVAFPNKVKEVTLTTARGETKTMTVVFDGKDGWGEFDGKVHQMDAGELRSNHEHLNLFEATHFLTPLLDKKKFKLQAINTVVIDGRRAAEIQVSREGYKDIKLYFDCETRLLVKSERRINDPRTGVECTEVRFFRSYQKLGGRMVPGTIAIAINEQQSQELHITDYTEMNEIDATEFAAPKGRQ